MNKDIEIKLSLIEDKLKNNPNDKNALIEKASIYSDIGFVEKALNALDILFKLEPNSEAGILIKSDLLYKIKQYDESLVCLDSLININPNNSKLWVKKALIMLEFKKTADVIDCFNKAIAIEPKNIDIWLKKLETLRFIRDKKGIWECLNQIRTLAPQRADLWVEIGDLLQESGKFDQALSFYDNLLKGNFKPEFTNTKKSEIFYRIKRYQEAIDCACKALSINPNNVDALCNKANSLFALGNKIEAIQEIDKAIDINPKNIKALMIKADISLSNKENLTAFDIYDTILNINPNYAPAWFKKGLINEMISEPESALSCYNKAIAANKNFLPAISNKAKILYKLSKFEECVTICDSYLKIKVDELEILHLKARCLGHLNRFEEIVLCNEKILALKGENIQILKQLGAALIATNRKSKAIEIFKLCLQKEPGNKDLYFQLANVVSTEKKFTDAIEYLNKAIEIDENFSEALNLKKYIENQIKLSKDKFAIVAQDKTLTKDKIKNLELEKKPPKKEELKICPKCGLDFVGKFCDNCGFIGEATGSEELREESLKEKGISVHKKSKKKEKAKQYITAFLTIWIMPRKTIRRILNERPRRMFLAFLMLMFGNSVESLVSGITQGIFNGQMIWAIGYLIGACGILSLIIAACQYYIYSAIVRIVSLMIGGKATIDDIRIALGWSNAPKVAILILGFGYYFVLGRNTSTEHLMLLIQSNPLSLIPVVIIGGIMFLVYIWSLFILVKCLAEANEFSFWRGILSGCLPQIIAGFIIGIFIAILVVVSTAFIGMSGKM